MSTKLRTVIEPIHRGFNRAIRKLHRKPVQIEQLQGPLTYTLQCSRHGAVEISSWYAQSRVAFRTPDCNGTEFNTLLSRMKRGDKIQITFLTQGGKQ
jgi:hypothetical protein